MYELPIPVIRRMTNDCATLSWWGYERLVRAANRNCFVCKEVLSIELVMRSEKVGIGSVLSRCLVVWYTTNNLSSRGEGHRNRIVCY